MKNQCCIDTINKIEKFLKERTMIKCFSDGEMKRVQFLPFEWSDFKKDLISEKKKNE